MPVNGSKVRIRREAAVESDCEPGQHPVPVNWQVHIAPFDSTRFLLNFQPVVPITLNDKWNVVMRFILPFLGEPVTTFGGFPASGTSDITFSLFLSHSKSKLIWGVGPVFGIPTSSDPQLTSGKFSVGPTGWCCVKKGPGRLVRW